MPGLLNFNMKIATLFYLFSLALLLNPGTSSPVPAPGPQGYGDYGSYPAPEGGYGSYAGVGASEGAAAKPAPPAS